MLLVILKPWPRFPGTSIIPLNSKLLRKHYQLLRNFNLYSKNCYAFFVRQIMPWYIYIFLKTFKLVDEGHLIKECSTEVIDSIYQNDDELVESCGKVDIERFKPINATYPYWRYWGAWSCTPGREFFSHWRALRL